MPSWLVFILLALLIFILFFHFDGENGVGCGFTGVIIFSLIWWGAPVIGDFFLALGNIIANIFSTLGNFLLQCLKYVALIALCIGIPIGAYFLARRW